MEPGEGQMGNVGMQDSFPSASVLEELRREDYRHVSPSLREPLRYLIARGFHIKDIHFHDAYEIVLDRSIPKSLEGDLPLPDRVERYDDHDIHDRSVGIGLICRNTNQVISGY